MPYNFGAGPAMLPREVMQCARDEFMDWDGTGVSIMEISHRSPQFMALVGRAEERLRALYAIPKDYKILFLAGGASAQFAMIPMNLTTPGMCADYLHTGYWSGRAIQEAQRFCRVNIATSSEKHGFASIADPEGWTLDPKSRYLYLAANETLLGVEFQHYPNRADLPLVADMSSTILSRPIDIGQFGLIFAGLQKNIGPAGMAIVIIRDDLIGHARDTCPSLYDYAVHVQYDNMFNTPPTFNWYMAGLVFEWIEQRGGVAAIAEVNQRKADKLYQFIDCSDFYSNSIDPLYRSWMNVSFVLRDQSMDTRFVARADEAGLFGLKGHRLVGGMRASLYNAMPEEGVDVLIDFMRDFERQFG